MFGGDGGGGHQWMMDGLSSSEYQGILSNIIPFSNQRTKEPPPTYLLVLPAQTAPVGYRRTRNPSYLYSTSIY